MRRPETVFGDNEGISKIVQYPEFQGIWTYVTTTHETNKNAIVETFIRTLRNYILKMLKDPGITINNDY
jgi:hypothetical protein